MAYGKELQVTFLIPCSFSLPNKQQILKEDRNGTLFEKTTKTPVYFFNNKELHCAIIFDALVIASVI